MTASRAEAPGRVRFQESNDADEFHALGLELFNSGRYEQAAEAFAKAVQLSPAWAEAASLGAGSLMRRRDKPFAYERRRCRWVVDVREDPTDQTDVEPRVSFAIKGQVPLDLNQP